MPTTRRMASVLSLALIVSLPLLLGAQPQPPAPGKSVPDAAFLAFGETWIK